VSVFRPNFTGVTRRDGNVVVAGSSSQDDDDKVLEIFVSLKQTEAIGAPAPVRVTRVGLVWEAEFPGASYVAGPAVAIGVEIRELHARTITWAELLTIP
jgi:hypothetical protein